MARDDGTETVVTKFVVLYLLSFLLNVPFGYMRSLYPEKTFKNFTIKMLLIHAPIPAIVLMRKYVFGIMGAHIWQSLLIFLVSVTICILGQLFGGRIVPRLVARRRHQSQEDPISPLDPISKE